jgi:hypothetical protein
MSPLHCQTRRATDSEKHFERRKMLLISGMRPLIAEFSAHRVGREDGFSAHDLLIAASCTISSTRARSRTGMLMSGSSDGLHQQKPFSSSFAVSIVDACLLSAALFARTSARSFPSMPLCALTLISLVKKPFCSRHMSSLQIARSRCSWRCPHALCS